MPGPENAVQKGQKGTVVNKPLKHVYICGKIIKLWYEVNKHFKKKEAEWLSG